MSTNGLNGCQDGSERRVGSLALRLCNLNILNPALRIIGGHRHNRDHTMVLHTGMAKVVFIDLVTNEVRKVTMTKPGDALLIPAKANHWVIALTPDVSFDCIFVRLNKNGELWKEGDEEDMSVDGEDNTDTSPIDNSEVDAEAAQIVQILGL